MSQRSERLATPARTWASIRLSGHRSVITSSGVGGADLRKCRPSGVDNAPPHPRIGSRFPFASIRRAIDRWADRVVDQALPSIGSASRHRGLPCLSDQPPPHRRRSAGGDRPRRIRATGGTAGHRQISRADRDRSTDRGAESRAAVRQATGLRTAGTRSTESSDGRPTGPGSTGPRAAGTFDPHSGKQFRSTPAQCIRKITIGNTAENGRPARRTNCHRSIRDFRACRAAAVSTAAAGLQFDCHDMSGPEVAGGAPAAAAGHVVGHPG